MQQPLWRIPRRSKWYREAWRAVTPEVVKIGFQFFNFILRYIKETAGERKGKVKLFDLGGEKYIVNITDGRIVKHKELTDLINQILMNYEE